MSTTTEALKALESAGCAARVIVLRHVGPAFCAGHDLKEMRANPGRGFMRETFETCAQLMLAITKLRQPVIAEVHDADLRLRSRLQLDRFSYPSRAWVDLVVSERATQPVLTSRNWV